MKIFIDINGFDSSANPVDIQKEFSGADLHKLFRQFEYWYFQQRALIAGPDVDDPEGGKRE